MRLNGVLQIAVAPGVVRQQLVRPQILGALLPGDCTVTETAPGRYDFALKKMLGFLEIRQSGQIELTEIDTTHQKLALRAAHRIGGAIDMQLVISLTAAHRGTDVGFDGTLQATGLAGRLLRDREGQVRPYVDRVFDRLRTQIETASSLQV